MADDSDLVHGTCVSLGRRAVLLRGGSGAGKSDLALRFLFVARRGPAALDLPALVADDQVHVIRTGTHLTVTAPETLRGKMEVRGLGIVGVRALTEADLVLVADLVEPAEVERMPDATVSLLGVEVPRIALAPFEASAPLKLVLALARDGGA